MAAFWTPVDLVTICLTESKMVNNENFHGKCAKYSYENFCF